MLGDGTKGTGGANVFVVAILGEVGVGKRGGNWFSNMVEGQGADLHF